MKNSVTTPESWKAIHAAALLAVVCFIRTPASACDWPTYHGDSSLAGVADTALPDRPVLLWRFKTDAPVKAPPVVGAGLIYAVWRNGGVCALDLKGNRVWSRQMTNESFSTPPICVKGTVLAGSAGGVLYAFDARDGRDRWRYTVGANMPACPNWYEFRDGRTGIIAIGESNDPAAQGSHAGVAVHCVDLPTGNRIWKADGYERTDSPAAVGCSNVVFGNCSASLFVLAAEDGKQKHRIEIDPESQVAAGAALAGRIAYSGSRSGKIVAADMEAGRIVWANTASASEALTTPAVAGTNVVYSSSDGNIYCLDRATGKTLWSFDTEGSPSAPVIAGNKVVVADDSSLFILDLSTGRKTWSFKVSDRITSPAVANGMIIVGTGEGTVVAFGSDAQGGLQ